MNNRQVTNFLCECFPHVDQLHIVQLVRKNPKWTPDQLYEQLASEYAPKEDTTTGYSIENAIEIEDVPPEEHVSDDPPQVETDYQLAMQLQRDEEQNADPNSLLKQLNLERKERSHTKPTTKSIPSSFLADLHEQRLHRTPPPQAPSRGIIKQKSPASELETARRKLKQKWRDTTPTAKTMTLSDLEKREGLMLENKAGNWGDDTPKSSRFQTLETLLYDEDRIGRESLRLTNEFRAKNNLPPLKWSQALCKIGREHSKNMAEGIVPFGHAGFDKRVAAYPFASTSAAENVAWNAGTSDIAKVAVDGWINSPGHRKNLLSNHNYCGIGVYRLSGKFYLTQLFALAK
jgi:uncharacterized protein YkwD